MTKKFSIVLLIIILLISGCTVQAKPEPVVETPITSEKNVAETQVEESPEVEAPLIDVIDIERLKVHMEALTSKEAAGRLPGTEGNLFAQNYIVDAYEGIGLEVPSEMGSYLHAFEMHVPIKNRTPQMSLLTPSGEAIQDFEYGFDYIEFIAYNKAMGKGVVESEFYIYDDPFGFKDIPENVILVLSQRIVGNMSADTVIDDLIAKKKPKGILYYSGQQNNGYFIGSPYLRKVTENDNENGAIICKITQEVFDVLSENQGNTVRLSVDTDIVEIEANNVVGFLPGATDEGFVITGHFDHLGENHNGTVNDGALDNASGVASMLAIAEELSKVENRQLSYYFVAFNGEEEGLLGSDVFASTGIVDPAKYKVVNLDMLGASQDVPINIASTHERSEAYADAFGKQMERYGFMIERTFMGNSDHSTMEQDGFVAFGMIDFDPRFYHTPFDKVENAIEYNRLKKITDAVYEWILEKK